MPANLPPQSDLADLIQQTPIGHTATITKGGSSLVSPEGKLLSSDLVEGAGAAIAPWLEHGEWVSVKVDGQGVVTARLHRLRESVEGAPSRSSAAECQAVASDLLSWALAQRGA